MLQTGAPHVPATPIASSARTLFDLLRLRAEQDPHRPAFFAKGPGPGGTWRATTWRELYEQAAVVAGGLRRLGLGRGDRVAIVGPTEARWLVQDLAAQLLGAVPIGVYPQQTTEQIRYLLEHSEARVLLVGDERELEAVVAAAKGLDHVVAIVPWDEAVYARHRALDPRLASPARLSGPRLTDAEIRESLDAIDPEDTALLVYTSGTTGPPKGAMISHRNITTMCGSSDALADSYQDDLMLSFLPMAHVAERVLSNYGRISGGIATAFASSIGAVLTEMREIAPMVFGSVPRLFEKAYSKIHGEIERKPKAVQRLFAWAKKVGWEHAQHVIAERPVPPLLRLQYALAHRLVFAKIKAVFGGRIRYFIVGAAPTPRPVLEFFWAAGLPIYEAYGMTEATAITHINRPGHARLGTVGRVILPSEHRLAEDGEILVRSQWVFKGYFKNEAATADMIRDGWLHTGDIGSVDGDGYVRITDRKKHLIITAGGKNLSPGNIEAAVKGEEPLISQVVPHGDGRPYVSAIIAPSPLETLEWGVRHGILTAQEIGRASCRERVSSPV